MFASGIFHPGYHFLTHRAQPLKAIVLACVALAWVLFLGTAVPAAAEPAPARQSQAQSVAPDDPMTAWFKAQDSLLDGILLRLSRIESLVHEIHRLIQQMPDPGVPAAAPVPVTAAPPVSPGAPVTAALPFTSPDSHIPEWLKQNGVRWAGGGLMLLLLLLIWARHRKTQPPSPAGGRDAAIESPARPETSPESSAPVGVPPQPAMPPAPAVEATPFAAAADADRAAEPQAKPRPLVSGSMGNAKTSEQALELAEIMLAMGLGQGAAKTLTAQIHNESKPALRNWLKLLDIYRQNGQQDEFERSAEELRLHFNVRPEDWQSSPEGLRSIEDYPHIAVRLTELWGKPACLDYLANLLGDNRDGARTGFPQAVAEELLLLSVMIQADGSTL